MICALTGCIQCYERTHQHCLEQVVKAGLQSLVVLLVVAMSNLYAYAVHKSKEEQVQGQVLGVEKHRVQSPDYTIGGSNPSDAPLTSRVYEYEVSIRVDCMTYVGTYQTPFNYLPAAFAPNQRKK